MEDLVHVMAVASTGAGAVCLYLSAPRQQWVRQPWPPLAARIGGSALLLLGFLLWCGGMHPAAAFFAALTVAMAAFIALPFSAALFAPQERRRPVLSNVRVSSKTGARPSVPIRPDWWSKALGGTLLGYPLAIALSGLFAVAGPGGLQALNKFQFTMWLVAPVWLGVASFCFLFRSGLRCWLWLGGANLLAFGALHVLR